MRESKSFATFGAQQLSIAGFIQGIQQVVFSLSGDSLQLRKGKTFTEHGGRM